MSVVTSPCRWCVGLGLWLIVHRSTPSRLLKIRLLPVSISRLDDSGPDISTRRGAVTTEPNIHAFLAGSSSPYCSAYVCPALALYVYVRLLVSATVFSLSRCLALHGNRSSDVPTLGACAQTIGECTDSRHCPVGGEEGGGKRRRRRRETNNDRQLT